MKNNSQSFFDAYDRIFKYIIHSPLIYNEKLSKHFHCELYFKCEGFQNIGAFKIRGAANVILQLPSDKFKKGCCTHSSGNHGSALAYMGHQLGIPIRIVVPENSSRRKIQKIQSYHSEIVFCENTLTAREFACQKIVDEFQSYLIHPYNDEQIIAGQGTIAIECMEDLPDVDIIIAPIGGGGLISGLSCFIKETKKNIDIIGAEPIAVNDAYRSFTDKQLHHNHSTDTIADGLKASLGHITFKYISHYVDDIITVTEEEIRHALRLILDELRIICEPSSAVSLAAIVSNQERFLGKKVILVLTGANIDIHSLDALISPH